MVTVDNLNKLTTTVEEEVKDYARARGWKAATHFVADHERQTYLVITVPDVPRPFPARAVVMARIVDGMVIIDEDTTDRPLVEELMRAGIPREQIICLYAGESLPDEKPES
jgi:hypothetical protein